MAKSSRSKAKDAAWTACSIYVRTRDAAKNGNKTMWIDTKDGCQKEVLLLRCCTCGKEYPAFGKGCAQAGHFIPGRNGAVLLDERGIHGQCYNCNVNLKGNPRKYEEFMLLTYGQDLIDELDLLSDIEVHYTEDDFRRIEKYFKDQTKLLTEKC